MIKLKIPISKKTGNKYSPWRKDLIENEIEEIRAYKLKGCGNGTVYYEALVEGKWMAFYKNDQTPVIKRKLPIIKQFDPIGKLVQARSTASSSGYQYFSEKVKI